MARAKDEGPGRGDVTEGDGAPSGHAASHRATEGGTASPAPDEPALSAFAAAVARKKAGRSAGPHLDGAAKVDGATSSRKTSRTFRRKSG